jgi:hypothetical protein
MALGIDVEDARELEWYSRLLIFEFSRHVYW